MKPDQQNIAIAKACGWTDLKRYHALYVTTGIDPLDGLRDDIPNYVNNLNAMHGAENVLTDPQKVLCYHMISDIVGDCGEPTENCFNVYHVTAAQRAEAFLRTLNLWTEA